MTARVAILINNPYVADARAWKTAVSLSRGRLRRHGRRALDAGRRRRPRRSTATASSACASRSPWRSCPAPGLPETASEARAGSPPCVGGIRETLGRAIQAARYLLMSRAWTDRIADEVGPFDVWQAESVITLGQAVALRERFGGRIVYDANDIDSEAGRMARLPGPWKQLLRRHERRLARAADAVVTVSDPYA